MFNPFTTIGFCSFKHHLEPRIIFLLNILLCDVVIAFSGGTALVMTIYHSRLSTEGKTLLQNIVNTFHVLTSEESILCYKEFVM